jgi:hypothetical protein
MILIIRLELSDDHKHVGKFVKSSTMIIIRYYTGDYMYVCSNLRYNFCFVLFN